MTARAPHTAVVMAGGRRTRLAPYTVAFPKPLMPIGDMPILELLVRQLKLHGVQRLVLAVGHLAPLIEAYFGDGRKWDISIEYSTEVSPLGTAGPLALVADLDATFLVTNGDLLTDLDFARFAQAHADSKSQATIGVHRRSVEISLGVIETNVFFMIRRPPGSTLFPYPTLF